MITVIHTIMMLGLFILPLLKKTKKNTPRVYKNDHDTTNARYAVNPNGYLEEVAGNKVPGEYID